MNLKPENIKVYRLKIMKKINFETIDSTNTWALAHIEELENKTVICADTQTNGRGRFENEWISQCCGNLYFSIVLKPEEIKYAPNLTQYLSVVITRVLKQYGLDSEIKWPNDILVKDKKIAGMLCETNARGAKSKGFVLGTGINLNMSGEELEKIPAPATSLLNETGQKMNKNEFFDDILDEFFKYYDEFLEKGFLLFKAEYEEKSNFLSPVSPVLNRKIFITNNGIKEECYAKSLNDDGTLTVIDSRNVEKKISAGDLSF